MKKLIGDEFPAGRWIPGRVLRPSFFTTPVRTTGFNLRTLKKPGDIAPEFPKNGWSFHLGLKDPEESLQARQFTSGYCLSIPSAETLRAVVLWSIAPGTWAGMSSLDTNPSLFCPKSKSKKEGNTSFLEAKDQNVLLSIRDQGNTTFFVLVTGCNERSQLATQADAVTPPLLDEVVAREMAARKIMADSDLVQRPYATLAHLAQESLIDQLRSGEGALKSTWSESRHDQLAVYDLNQVTALVQAWSIIDPAIAEELARTEIGCIQPNGRLPAWQAPSGEQASSEAACPLLARACLLVFHTTGKITFAHPCIPALKSYLEWALGYFDPSRDGYHCWQSPAESFSPDTYDRQLASADLASMLLAELDALTVLQGEASESEGLGDALGQGRELLVQNLYSFFWEPNAGAFKERYVGQNHVARVTLSSVIPLMWGGLGDSYKDPLLRQITQSKSLGQSIGVSLWQEWENDDEVPPIRAEDQLLVLQSLQTADAARESQQISRQVLSRLQEQFKKSRTFSNDLSEVPAEDDQSDRLSSVETCALLLYLLSLCRGRSPSKSPSRTVQWLERHRIPVVGIPVALALLLLVGIMVAFLLKRNPPLSTLQAQTGLATRHYQEGRYNQAVTIYERLLRSMPNNQNILTRLGNAYFQQGSYPQAEETYVELLKKGKNPSIQYNLGLTQLRLGKIEEARASFLEILQEYRGKSPPLAERARHSLEIMEGTLYPEASFPSVPE